MRNENPDKEENVLQSKRKGILVCVCFVLKIILSKALCFSVGRDADDAETKVIIITIMIIMK